MYDSVITLKKAIYNEDNTDDYGNLLPCSYRLRDVYAELSSIGQKEFYEAAAGGFKPECKFLIADCSDYDNEEALIHNGIEYNIIRTYRAPNQLRLEITCGKGLV